MKAFLLKYVLKLAFFLGYEEPVKEKIVIGKVEARGVINSILDRPIEWVNWRELDEQKRVTWGNYAKDALSNPALQCIIGKVGVEKTNGELVKNIIEAMARHTKSFQEVENLRMTINGIELVREYLEDMLIVDQQTSKDSIFEAI